MNRDLQLALTNELTKTIGSLAAKIDVFQITQDSFVATLLPDLKQFLTDLSEEELKAVAAVYGICLTDDSLKNYTPLGFAEDVSYLRSLIPKSEENTPEVKEEPAEEPEEKEIKRKEDLEPVPTKTDPGMSWKERLEQAQEHQSHLIKVLAAYYQSNIDINNFLTNFANDLVLHHVNDRIELAISSILIREHVIPLLGRIFHLYMNAGIQLDLRFIMAQIHYSTDVLLNSKGEFRNIYNRFLGIQEIYPLGEGEDIYWDMAKYLFYDKYYEPLKQMVHPIIDEQKKEKLESAQAVKNIMDAPKPRQGSTESLRSNVDSLIFETVKFGRPFEGEQRIKAQRLIESILKRLALEEFGKQDIPQMEKYKEYFMREFFEPIMKEYPQFLLPFIDSRLYRDFSEDPLGHFEKNRNYILNQFWFKMRKLGYPPNGTPKQIAIAFAGLLQEVLNDPRVQSFEA